MKLRNIIFAVLALFAIPAAVTHADDGLRMLPAALLQQVNTWAQPQTFAASPTKFDNGTGGYTTAWSTAAPNAGYFEIFGSGRVRYGFIGFGSVAEMPYNADGTNRHSFYTGGVLDAQITKDGIVYPKLSAAPTAAPGAGKSYVFMVAGTNAGTCKLQMMAGTSTTPSTIFDNVGGGC